MFLRCQNDAEGGDDDSDYYGVNRVMIFRQSACFVVFNFVILDCWVTETKACSRLVFQEIMIISRKCSTA